MRLLNRPFILTMLTCFAFIVVILSLLSEPVRAQQHTLHILYEEPLALKLTSATSSDQGFTHVISASVLVRNDGPSIDTLKFSVVIPNKETEDEAACGIKVACVTIPESSDLKDKHIDAFVVKRFDLQFSVTETDPPESITGYLVVKAEKENVKGAPEVEVVPGTMPVTLNKPVVSKVIALLRLSQFKYLSEGLVGLAFAIAAIFTPVTYFCVKPRLRGTDWLQMKKGYSSSESWASTLTGIGALLGTVLTAGVLPDETQTLSLESYAFLNLLFGILILAAGLIYTIWHKPDAEQEKITVKLFLMLAILTLWATLGELLTVVLLVGEMELHGTVSIWIFWLLLVLLLLAFLGAGFYAWRSIRSSVKATNQRPQSSAGDAAVPPVTQPGPKAALL